MTKAKMNPHNYLEALDPPRKHPPRRWKCYWCHAEGTYEELQAIECTYEYPPCEVCGQTPECAPDCAGMAAALSNPRIHIAGSLDTKGDA